MVYVFFQAEDGIRSAQESRGLGDVYKRQTAYYQRASSGKIGCLPDDIEISNLKKDTWMATCKGKKFICSYAETGQYQAVLSCTPEIK